MRVLACGAAPRASTGERGWEDTAPIWGMLEHLYEVGYRTLIHGDAPGADKLAGEVGALIGYSILAFPADWREHGRAAGPIRNRQMLREAPDLVIAFHDDLSKSAGTRDMCRISNKAGIPVLVYSHSAGWYRYREDSS